ncbi:phospholipase D-like domain-containing protein [Nitrosopumilus sp.]|uniref:phospholipase D-like domain-containing protein n=1 Tax=Nitrosopumilus sp. TaxID=2024843 RepID=UPI00262905F7|nr:phospholipase D-like domain-containing protein [Nitrosopumilus sp.]
MQYRHKKTKIVDKTFSLTGFFQKDPVAMWRLEILHAGKIDHKLVGNFKVLQENNSKHTIKCHLVTDIQLVEFAESYRENHPSLFSDGSGTLGNPPNFIYSSGSAISEGTFEVSMEHGNVLYAILDNRFSKLAGKKIQLVIWEEWDEQIQSLDVVTTIPTNDNSLLEDVKRFISASQNELKIITPHIDMFLIQDILARSNDTVKIQIITRERNSFSKSGKEAFDYIRKMLGKDHRTNDYVHSRVIIRDNLEALVSSADLNQDSMIGQYNAGILLSNPDVLQKLVNFFNQVWIDSKT